MQNGLHVGVLAVFKMNLIPNGMEKNELRGETRRTVFLLIKCSCYVLNSFSGEATEDELFSRLQNLKNGAEQQSNTPSTENVEEPSGKLDISFAFYFKNELVNQ